MTLRHRIVSDPMTRDPDSARDATDSRPCRSCSRRTFLQGALGAGVAISIAPVRAQDATAASSALPKAGDRLVFADGERAGREIKPEDLVLGEQQTMGWAIDPATNVIRNGSRLNEVLVLRLAQDSLDDNTRPYAAEGVVAYSAICKHEQCPVTGWNKEKQALHCFCHASEYDPRKSAAVVFGPAPRPLPILPLKIVDGTLTVAASFRGKVGNRPV
jgi:rieske iron-sulfur protein